MKPLLSILPLALLAACATQQEICVSRAQSDLLILKRLAAETEANITRGYGLGRREVPYTIEETCRVRQDDGTTIRQICSSIGTKTETFPVTINIAEERANLRALRARLPRAERAAQAAVRRCMAQYPQ